MSKSRNPIQTQSESDQGEGVEQPDLTQDGHNVDGEEDAVAGKAVFVSGSLADENDTFASDSDSDGALSDDVDASIQGPQLDQSKLSGEEDESLLASGSESQEDDEDSSAYNKLSLIHI